MSLPYTKKWLSVSDQLQRLQSRGLAIADPTAAADFLSHINYYRFTGYGLVFEQPRHTYLAGTTFEQIRQAYEFDRALRDLFTESIELIELDLRTTLAHTFGEIYGPFGHVDPRHFFSQAGHPEWLSKLRAEAKRSRELFIDHYKATYHEFPDLPIWVATEVMSFGALSRMLEALNKSDLKRIAVRYRLQPLTLVSCVHHLVSQPMRAPFAALGPRLGHQGRSPGRQAVGTPAPLGQHAVVFQPPTPIAPAPTHTGRAALRPRLAPARAEPDRNPAPLLSNP